jgi:hypothetical protein
MAKAGKKQTTGTFNSAHEFQSAPSENRPAASLSGLALAIEQARILDRRVSLGA